MTIGDAASAALYIAIWCPEPELAAGKCRGMANALRRGPQSPGVAAAIGVLEAHVEAMLDYHLRGTLAAVAS